MGATNQLSYLGAPQCMYQKYMQTYIHMYMIIHIHYIITYSYTHKHNVVDHYCKKRTLSNQGKRRFPKSWV